MKVQLTPLSALVCLFVASCSAPPRPREPALAEASGLEEVTILAKGLE